jgi:hypothetical protein
VAKVAKERDEIVRMCGLLVCKGVLPDHCQMMVVEREKVDRLTHKNQHAQGVPPSPYRYEGGRTSSPPKNYFFDVLVCKWVC